MTQSAADVSVCVTTFNSAATLQTSLDSVLRQSIQPIEVLVADDGSSDETVEIASSTGDQRVRVLKSPTNRGGPAWGRNAALAESRGAYIAFLDADDTWRTDKLLCQVEAMTATGAQASCTAAVAKGAESSYSYPVGLHDFDHKIGFLRLVMLNHIVASSAIVDRKLLVKVGGFPNRDACIGFEDYCAWLKVATQTEWAFVASPLVHYSVGQPSIRTTRQSSQAKIRVECRRELGQLALTLPSCAALFAFAGFSAVTSSIGHLSAIRHPWPS